MEAVRGQKHLSEAKKPEGVDLLKKVFNESFSATYDQTYREAAKKPAKRNS